MRRPAPRFLSLQINKRCNLRCGHCEFWTKTDDDKTNYLNSQRLAEIIEEFAAINPKGSIVICGGEPMLDIDRYFDMARLVRQSGLRSLSVVNGTRIRSMAMAERMIAEGPDEVSISLNSHQAALHDETRGVVGAFDKATTALRLLLEARAKAGTTRPRIYVMGLVFNRNYRDLEAFHDFVLNELGVDKLKLNFIQPSFGQEAADPFFARHAKLDADELAAVIRRCDARFKLGLNPIWLEQVRMYFRSLQRFDDLELGWGSEARSQGHLCNTYDRNIMVDHYGMARLCFSSGFRGEQLQRYGDLRKFWEGSGDVREEMTGCNRLCGISHSVRRETSTTASRHATQTATTAMINQLAFAINGV
jgi:MoaA/NifB/PqqE/SkfB family radical SAM enzyme